MNSFGTKPFTETADFVCMSNPVTIPELSENVHLSVLDRQVDNMLGMADSKSNKNKIRVDFDKMSFYIPRTMTNMLVRLLKEKGVYSTLHGNSVNATFPLREATKLNCFPTKYRVLRKVGKLNEVDKAVLDRLYPKTKYRRIEDTQFVHIWHDCAPLTTMSLKDLFRRSNLGNGQPPKNLFRKVVQQTLDRRQHPINSSDLQVMSKHVGLLNESSQTKLRCVLSQRKVLSNKESLREGRILNGCLNNYPENVVREHLSNFQGSILNPKTLNPFYSGVINRIIEHMEKFHMRNKDGRIHAVYAAFEFSRAVLNETSSPLLKKYFNNAGQKFTDNEDQLQTYVSNNTNKTRTKYMSAIKQFLDNTDTRQTRQCNIQNVILPAIAFAVGKHWGSCIDDMLIHFYHLDGHFPHRNYSHYYLSPTSHLSMHIGENMKTPKVAFFNLTFASLFRHSTIKPELATIFHEVLKASKMSKEAKEYVTMQTVARSHKLCHRRSKRVKTDCCL